MSGSNDFRRTSRATLEQDYRALMIKYRQLEQEALHACSEEASCLEQVEETLTAHGGYYRVGRDRIGQYWVRYKWTGLHPLAGRYTFGSGTTVYEGLLACDANIIACLAGKRVAHVDKGRGSK